MAMASEVAIFERPELQDDIRPLYAETLSLVERLHRRLLDVIKDESTDVAVPTSTPFKPCCFITSATRN